MEQRSDSVHSIIGHSLLNQPLLQAAIEESTGRKNWDILLDGTGREKVFGSSSKLMKDGYDALDQLSEGLSKFDLPIFSVLVEKNDFRIPKFSVQIEDLSAEFNYIASGNFGLVFRLTINNSHYAFKVFYRRPSDLLYSGPFGEIALGAFVTNQNVSNMPHLIVGNPGKGWLISEFIDNDFKNIHAKGPTWQELGLRSLDPEVNHANVLHVDNISYRVDYGHLTNDSRPEIALPPIIYDLFKCRDDTGYVSGIEYKRLMNGYPHLRVPLLRHLMCLDPEIRLDILQEALLHDEIKYFPVQDFFKTSAISEEETGKIFDIVRNHPDPFVRSRAVFNIQRLPEQEQLRIRTIWNEHPDFLPLRLYLNSNLLNGDQLRKLWLNAKSSEVERQQLL